MIGMRAYAWARRTVPMKVVDFDIHVIFWSFGGAPVKAIDFADGLWYCPSAQVVYEGSG